MISNQEAILRLCVAALLGSLIGLERERLMWAAGLRTHMLVCVASCLIMIISAFSFGDVLGTSNVILDPSRIAAQVVSGIGFLGAGVILFRGDMVRGLTTAASIWTVAGIGLAVGGGLYIAAIATTIIILIILIGIKPFEEKIKISRTNCVVEFLAKHGQISMEILSKAIGNNALYIQQLIIQPSETEKGFDVVHLTLTRMPRKRITALVQKIKSMPAVYNHEVTII